MTGFFFNGRLYTSPTVASRVDDSGLDDRALASGQTLALIGRSVAGQPNTPLSFTSPDQVRAALVSGDLVDAATRCFSPSSDESVGAPAKVVVVRVNPALQSTLVLRDGTAAAVINLASTGYGNRENQDKIKIEAATTRGLKVTTQRVIDTWSADNIYRNAFQIQYSGASASAVMTVGPEAIVLQNPSGTTTATIDLNLFPTVQELVDKINTVPGMAATVQDGNGLAPTLQGLDAVTTQDIKTAAYVATANLQAVVDWINGPEEGLFVAVRATDVGTLPAAIPFTYATGATDGTVTNTEWTNAFTALQTADVQWVVPLSTDPSIHAMVSAHSAYMSTVAASERRGVVGTPLSTSDAAAIVLAKAINSDRVGMVHLGCYDYNDAGALTLFPPYIVAAMIAAGFAGSDPGTSMTNKALNVRGIERKLRNPGDTDALIRGGVIPVEDGSRGVRVTKSISTWLTNSNFNRVELSVGSAVDFTMRVWRQAMTVLIGGKGTPLALSTAVSITESVFRQLAVPAPNGPGVLVGDANSPPYKNITAKLVGDAIYVSAEVSPVIPSNFIGLSVHAVPFSGTASA
jgi:hypothetical protein